MIAVLIWVIIIILITFLMVMVTTKQCGHNIQQHLREENSLKLKS